MLSKEIVLCFGNEINRVTERLKKKVEFHSVLNVSKVFNSNKNVIIALNTFSKPQLIIFTFMIQITQERYDTEIKWKNTNEQLLNFQNEVNHLCEADTKLHDLQTKYIKIQNKLDVYEKHVSQLEDGNKTLREKNTAIENGLM
jgi:hypothetical protein